MFLGNVGRQVFKVGVYSIRIYSIEVNAKLFEIIPIIGDGESFSITVDYVGGFTIDKICIASHGSKYTAYWLFIPMPIVTGEENYDRLFLGK